MILWVVRLPNGKVVLPREFDIRFTSHFGNAFRNCSAAAGVTFVCFKLSVLRLFSDSRRFKPASVISVISRFRCSRLVILPSGSRPASVICVSLRFRSLRLRAT